ncbi:MAG: QueT transporter family protein [Deltaproteobacteria bacterium]|nr:QueT transporter family protein [Deltaproteobacteria bacterium]
MVELFTMWRSTRMVVLVAVTAASYVAVLVPFKIAVILPGLTEVRPGAAIPILLSFLFGPAAAWGAAIGNTIGDMLGGMFGPGSIVGFAGNFLYGYVPYVFWRALRGRARPGVRGARDWVLVILISLISSFTIAGVIGWGADALGLAPYAAIGNIILVNNSLASLLLAVPLLAALYPRVEKAGLLWHEIMDNEPPVEISNTAVTAASGRGVMMARLTKLRADSAGMRQLARRALGVLLLTAGAVAAVCVGNALSIGLMGVSFGVAGFAGQAGTATVAWGLLPFIALIFVGALLL